MLKVRDVPSLVGVGDEARIRHGLADCGEALRVTVAAKLEFQQGIGRRLARGCGHGFGGGEGEREGRLDGVRRWNPGKLGGASAGELRFQVPKRAIECVAGRSRRQQFLQAQAGEPAGQRPDAPLDRLHDAGDTFTIAGIGHALATAGDPVSFNLGHDDHGLALGAPGDGEPVPDRPGLHPHLHALPVTLSVFHPSAPELPDNAFLSSAFSFKNKPLKPSAAKRLHSPKAKPVPC